MDIEKIKGSTYWIQSATNVGIYVFEDREALLIDVGRCGKRQDNILKALEKENIEVKYIISTHEHEDHCGGNYDMKNAKKDIKLLSSKEAKPYIENGEIYMDYIGGGRRSEIVKTQIEKMMVKGAKVDQTVEIGEIEIKGHRFEIFSGRGHTVGSIGVITEDKVGFFGDLLISRNCLEKFQFLFMCDYKEQVNSLNNIKELDFEQSVLGHSRKILTKEETLELAEYNKEILLEQINFGVEKLKEPKSLDELVKEYLDEKKMVCKYVAYIEYRNSINSLVSYLLDEGDIDYRLDDNILKYIAK